METQSKTPSLVYEVTFGAVFKVRLDGQRVTAVSKRDRNNRHWLPAQEIEDHTKVYDDLGDDEFAIVHIDSKDDVVRLRDIFRAGLLGDGDTGTVARAIKAKKLGEVLEKALHDWLKKSGPLLQHEDGLPSILNPEELTARYDLKDTAALRLAYAHELKEGATADSMPAIEKAIERFNKFLDKVVEGDELYWFEHLAPLADRIGYVILRNGRIAYVHIVLMS
jgi:hypothetical protein